jgi:SAM-dependent methyltransferase
METFNPAAYGDCAWSFYDQLVSRVEPALLATLAELSGRGPVLDLGIGTGRVAIPLHRLGVRVHGIEASAAMIAAFRSRAGNEGIPVTEGDFTTSPLGCSRYTLIYSLISTFSLLPSLSLQQACLRNIARHLVPGGLFVSEGFDGPTRYPLPDSSEVYIDTPTGVSLYRVVALSTPLPTMDELASSAGLTLSRRWSNWSRTPYEPPHPRHISVYALEEHAAP